MGVDILFLCLSASMAGFAFLIRRKPREPEQSDRSHEIVRERSRYLMWTGVAGVIFFGLRVII